ncbi:Leucine-rich repeat containing protein [Entamoeba marina]
MSVIQYLDSLDTLFIFNQVSSHCDDAIGRLKINPAYKERDLETMLQSSRLPNALKEYKIFTGLETFHVDINSLEKMSLKTLDRVKLFEIPYFIIKNNFDKYKNLIAIQNRIASYGIDLSHKENLEISNLVNLREIRLRVGRLFSQDLVKTVINGLKTLRHLRKIIVQCDAQNLNFFWELLKDVNLSRTYVIFKLNWLKEEDCPTITKISNIVPIGIYMNGFNKFHDIFFKYGVSLLYFTDYYFQISNQMAIDKRITELFKLYFPFKIEIQGNYVAHVGDNKIIKLRGCHCLKELFLNEMKYDVPIRIELSESLERLTINNLNSIEQHGLLGLELTKVPKTEYGKYSAAV